MKIPHKTTRNILWENKEVEDLILQRDRVNNLIGLGIANAMHLSQRDALSRKIAAQQRLPPVFASALGNFSPTSS